MGACQGRSAFSRAEAGQASKDLEHVGKLRTKLGRDRWKQGGQDEQAWHHSAKITFRLEEFEEIVEDWVLDNFVQPGGLFPHNVAKDVDGNIASRTAAKSFRESITEQFVMRFFHRDQ